MTPHLELRKGLTTFVLSKGYKMAGFPRVEIYSFDTSNSLAKELDDFEITFVIEVVANDCSQSLSMIDNIRSSIENELTISNYKIVYLVKELLNEIEEITETELSIWRQIQRIRIKLKKK